MSTTKIDEKWISNSSRDLPKKERKLKIYSIMKVAKLVEELMDMFTKRKARTGWRVVYFCLITDHLLKIDPTTIHRVRVFTGSGLITGSDRIGSEIGLFLCFLNKNDVHKRLCIQCNLYALEYINIDINGKKTYSTDPFCNGQLSIHTCCVLHKMTCTGLSFVQYKETNFSQIKTSHFWYRRH